MPTQDLMVSMVFDNASNTLLVGEVQNGVSSPGQQVIFAFSASGARSTYTTGLFEPFGLADFQAGGSATPEPASVFLLAGGAGMIARLRRRR